MTELTQEEFDRERDRFLGMMFGQDPAEVWKSQAKKYAVHCDALEAALRTLIDNVESGSYESTGMAVDQARVVLAATVGQQPNPEK